MTSNRKPRVLFIIESLSYGGVERRRLALCKRLIGDYDIQLVCTQKVGDLHLEFDKIGVQTHAVGILGLPWSIKAIRNTLKVVRQFKPDIVHGGVFEGLTLANLTGFFTPGLKVISEETSAPRSRTKKAEWLMKLLVIRSKYIVAVSQGTERYLTEVLRLSSKKVRMIRNAVEQPRKSDPKNVELLRKELGIPDGQLVVGSVGRHFKLKRYEDLLEAMVNVDATLLLVGAGPEHENLKGKASALGIVGRVHFVGMMDDPGNYYELMDVFCLLSESESFGLVLVEAMYHSLPLVATRVGGIPEIVKEGETGFLVDPYSPDQVSERLNHLLNDKTLRDSMGENGEVRALEDFNVDEYAIQIKELYQTILPS